MALNFGVGWNLVSGDISINIVTDKVEVARDVCTTAVSLGALYFGYKLLRPVIETAVRNGLGGERDDQEVRGIRPGSLHVLLHFLTEERFLEVLANYESGKMKECLQKEFSQVGIKVEGLKVEIENMVDVNKTKEDIKKGISTYNRRLPRDENALLKEANSLGLLNIKPDLTKPRAKLLACVYKSHKIQRSINHVSFLLVGPTGGGKSATINHLLGTTLAETNKFESNTRCTEEFVIYGSDPQHEVDELPLGLVDTPGFDDTEGTKQDARNFLSIREFFRIHKHLNGHYANLIFLTLKADDNRIGGKEGSLGKALRCIKVLDLVDRKNPNVVVVLTHAGSVRKKYDKEWIKEMEDIRSNAYQLVRENLKVTAPVVLIENHPRDCKLKVKGDYTRLKNNELQPKNLYDVCAQVLKKNGDDLALITLNSIFVNITRNNSTAPRLGHKIDAETASGHGRLDDEAGSLADILESQTERGPSDPVFDAILNYIKEKKLGPREADEAMDIGRTLLQLGLGQDTPRSVSMQSIEYYFHGDEISSEGQEMLSMLKEKFGITMKPPNTAIESGCLIGQGYNILTDKPVPTQVMKFSNTKTKHGIVIPTCATFEKVQQTKFHMEEFENEESYTQSRLTNLNIGLEANSKLFKAGYRAGYNKKDDPTSLASSASELSFLFEQRMFKLSMGNYKESMKDGMAFTLDFISDVGNLPSKYDRNDDSCKNRFEKFFSRFGHFTVTSAYGGGSVEIKCSKEATRDRSESFEDTKDFLVELFQKLDMANTEISGSGSSSDNTKANSLLKRCSSCWQGGDVTLHSNKTVISADKEKFQKWRTSLIANPTMLTSEMTLEPISTVVACVGQRRKGDATFEALKDVLRGESDILVKKEKFVATLPTAEKKSRRRTNEAITRKDTIQQPDETKCFSSSSLVSVQSKSGVKKQTKMMNLDVGDKVMAWDEKRNRAIFTEVIMFAHRAADAIDVEYLKFTLEDGNEITLSSNHLVMAGKHKNATMAQNVKRGEILFAVDENGEISPKKVLAVDKVIEQGVYCPITVHGNLVVDNVLASCYASVQDHVFHKGLVKISAQSMAHFALMPMRALHKLRFKWWREIPNGQAIHPYLQWLYKLNLPFVAN